MTFSDLPAGARLRLHRLTGEKVRSFSADSTGIAKWDGRNEDGEEVPSGIYLVRVEGQGGDHEIKVILQR
jgi:flagellar hook assembly protein FlgD